MIDLIRRALFVGVGVASLTRDRIEQFVNDAVARGEMTSEQGKSLLDEVTQRAEDQQDKIEQFVRRQVERALEAAHIATRSDFEELERRIERLEIRGREPGASRPSPIIVESGVSGGHVVTTDTTVITPESALDPTDPNEPPGG